MLPIPAVELFRINWAVATNDTIGYYYGVFCYICYDVGLLSYSCWAVSATVLLKPSNTAGVHELRYTRMMFVMMRSYRDLMFKCSLWRRNFVPLST